MNLTLANLVDRAAERDADHHAFRCQRDSISYSKLAARCNQVSNFLLQQGVQRGDRVGLLLPRCLASAIAVHGIMKSGAAFVPIDPLTPVNRIRQIVDDCQIRHLITDKSQRRSIAELLSEKSGIESILGTDDATDGLPRKFSWDSLDQFSDRPPTANPAVNIGQQDLAYIMYTSGSTGRPKGIMHTHYSGLSYAELSAATYDVSYRDCIGNHSPLHFDMSTFGYLTAPLAGATTVIIPAAYTKLPASLSQLIEAERMTIWYSVPFALIQLLLRGAMEQRDLTSLRWVLFGGEPFSPKHLRSLMQAWPHARFSNVYGPAEVNQCTYYHVPSVGDDLGPIPIGKIWDRTESLVLDDDREVADQEPGELLIRSPTMMRGYWSQPDLDEAVFYERKVDDETHRFYRTGDIVRQDLDGTLHFIGRKDRQIKFRGHRIELDDIEITLSAHPAVEEVAAFPIKKAGEVVDIAVTLLLNDSVLHESGKNHAKATDFSVFAAESLPKYALPTILNIVDTLPRTTSGKIDRRRLQSQAQDELASEQRHEK